MQALVLKLLMKVATETFLAEALIQIARHVAKSTDNTLDDDLIATIAKALNVTTVDQDK